MHISFDAFHNSDKLSVMACNFSITPCFLHFRRIALSDRRKLQDPHCTNPRCAPFSFSAKDQHCTNSFARRPEEQRTMHLRDACVKRKNVAFTISASFVARS